MTSGKYYQLYFVIRFLKIAFLTETYITKLFQRFTNGSVVKGFKKILIFYRFNDINSANT